METKQSFDVFLSHNGRDKMLIESIARRLEDEEGLRPWLDKWNLIAGEPWQEAIEEALDASRTCAVFLGPSGIGSWENEEMRAALSIRAKRDGFRVIPVLFPGASLPEPLRLPPFLARLTWVDFRSGLDDQWEFRCLVAGIRGSAPGRDDHTMAAPPALGCPYRGLEVFEEDHAKFFFGRESLSQQVIEALLRHRFVPVLGPSGCGKSSLVRAGVIPQLKAGKLPHSETWTYLTLRPGAHPLSALAECLIGLDAEHKSLDRELQLLGHLESDERALHLCVRLFLSDKPKTAFCLLFTDQFEEILTLCNDDQEREQFLLNLRYASTISGGRVVTVLTLRADFMERAAAQRNLAEMLSGYQLIVSPMDNMDLRRAIEEPGALARLRFEEGLVELILEDVGHEPGALPLLEDALTQLYEHRGAENVASLQSYQALGGVHGALAKRAEKIFEEFSPPEKEIARQVFLRLTQPSEGTADTRRRAELNELWPDPAHQPAVEKVIERLVESRLLTMSSDPKGARMVDVAHEALIRGWPRLHGWIEVGRESLRIHRGITDAAREWRAQNRDAGLLYRGVRLSEALELKRKRDSPLNALEGEFIDASDEAQRREARAAWLRRFGTLTAVPIILALGAFTIRACREQQAARLRDIVSRVKQFKNTDPELSLRLAIEAANISRTSEVESALRQALGAFPEAVALRGHKGVVGSIDYSKDGRNRIVTAGDDGTARIWDGESGKVLYVLSDHEGEVNHAIFSPNGEKVVTAGADGTALVWDAETGKEFRRLLVPESEDEILGVDFSLNGDRVVTSGGDDKARIWDVESGELKCVMSGHEGDVNRVDFNPDDKTVATASDDKTARIWDAQSCKELHVLSDHTNAIIRLDHSPKGDLLATASKDKTVRIWDARTGKQKHVLEGHTGIVNSVAFSPDGMKVVTASDDMSARIWDVNTARTLPVLVGHTGFIYRAEFSPDPEGKYVVTASADKTVRLWETNTGQMLSVLQGHNAEELYATFSPDGSRVAAVGHGTAWIWKVGTSQPTLRMRGHDDEIWSVAFSPDGQFVITGSGNEISRDNTARIWSVKTGQEVRPPIRHTDRVQSAAFSPDGRYVVTACFDRKARVWEVGGERPLLELDGRGRGVWDAAFSQDGSKIITAHKDKVARIWDARTGESLHNLTGHKRTVRSADFSPDGRYVVTASEDATARIWEAQTGQEVTLLRGHFRALNSAAFSPDGQYVVTTSLDRTARLWDVKTGKTLRVLKGHIGSVTSAAFSPNGKYVVTTGRDHTARLWDVHTGQQFSLLHGHNDIVRSAAFSPDGEHVVTAGTDKTVRIYSCEECVPLENLLKLAVARDPRWLDDEEQREYLLGN